MVGYFNPRHVKKIRGFKNNKKKTLIASVISQTFQTFSEIQGAPSSDWMAASLILDSISVRLKMRYILDDSRVDFRGLPHCWTSPFSRVPNCLACWQQGHSVEWWFQNIAELHQGDEATLNSVPVCGEQEPTISLELCRPSANLSIRRPCRIIRNSWNMLTYQPVLYLEKDRQDWQGHCRCHAGGKAAVFHLRLRSARDGLASAFRVTSDSD